MKNKIIRYSTLLRFSKLQYQKDVTLTLPAPPFQNLQKISVEHCGYNSWTKEAQKQDWRTEELTDSLQAPSPNNGQS